MKPILVTSYVHPDLDGIASMVAYAEFLQKSGADAVPGILGEPHIEALSMLRHVGVTVPDTLSDTGGFDAVVLVDASEPGDLAGLVDVAKVTEVIDHREVHHAGAFPNAHVQIELVGAAATLVAEKFMHGSVEPSLQAAALLCGGIVSNTLAFKAAVTTDRDRQAFTWLNRIANIPEEYWDELFMEKSDVSGDELSRRMLGDLKRFTFGGTRVGIAEIEMIGARELMRRSGEIVQVLEHIKSEHKLDIVFMNTVDLEESRTFLVASGAKAQQLLHDSVQAEFVGDVAELPYLLMRKQITPRLKRVLE